MSDAIDLTTAILVPSDVQDFAVTKTITALSTGPKGIDVQFDSADWPDVTPDGWSGPIFYTLWLGARLADGVHLAASLNVYRGQMGSGAGDVTNIGQYSQNLWYLDPALKAHIVTEGETLYAMVTAGGWRGVKAPTVAQRSNVVAFTASSAPKTFTYDTPPVIVPPQPPIVTPPDDLSARLDAIDQALGDIRTAIMALAQKAAPDYETHLPIHAYVASLDIVLKPKA